MANRNVARETVVGVFQDRGSAQQAIERLRKAGFRSDDIGILMQNQEGAQDLADETGTKAGEAAGIGATSGGLLGALGGLLVGLGVLAIPGVGPVLAAGPLVAALGPIVGGTLTGAAIGAGTGALAGALVGLGIPEEEAQVYEQRFRQGAILVTVKAGASRYDEAASILRQAGAEDIEYGGAAAGARTQGQAHDQGHAYGYNTGRVAASGADRVTVPVVEESLSVQKQGRQAGEVEIRKDVVQEQVSIPVELRHEEVTVTRREVDRPLQAGEQVFREGEVISVPLYEESVDVQKQARVTGEVEIRKQVVSERQTISDTVRREVVDVDAQGDLEARGDQGYQYGQEQTGR